MTVPPQARIVVLYVDDNDMSRRALARILERYGIDLLTVSSREEGFSMLSARCLLGLEPIAAVVTDYLMPDGDGIDVLRGVRARWPETPVVLLTGAYDERVHAAGFSYTFEKPVEAAQLAATLRRLADERAK